MSVKEYIASGILETYVLGGLDLKEIQEVERMASLHPEVKKEISQLQDAFESYAESIAIKPKGDLKNKILSKLPDTKKDTKIVSVAYYKYATAASVALMVFCGTLALYFRSQWIEAEQKLVAIEEKTSRLAGDIQKANLRIDQMAGDFDAIKDTSVVRVTMKGVGLFTQSSAIVFWNKNTGQVLIDPGNLPKAPEGMQYQLWALKDGLPIDAGVFETESKTGLQKVKIIQAAEAYAVTLEKRGGSAAPTLTAMYVFGGV
jgi:anti-sigma-K factor RskA